MRQTQIQLCFMAVFGSVHISLPLNRRAQIHA